MTATQAKKTVTTEAATAKVTPIKPAPKAGSISLSVTAVTTPKQFKAMLGRLAKAFDFSTDAVQAMLPFAVEQYGKDNFAPLNELDSLVASKQAGVTYLRKYVKRFTNGDYDKVAKQWGRKANAKRSTVKALSGTWKQAPETPDDIRKRADEAMAKGNKQEADRLETKAVAMEVRATEKAKVSGIAELIKCQAKIAKSANEGTAKNEALNTEIAKELADFIDRMTVIEGTLS